MQTFSKTRIAPTPSGFLHLGNVFSFALTAGLAARMNAAVLLRIDDLDQERANEVFVQDIFDTLHFLNIPFSEGPQDYPAYKNTWSQLHRLPLYQQALEELKPHVFACDCSRTQIARAGKDGVYPGTCRDKNIPLDTPGVAWRLRTAHDATLRVRTLEGPVIETALPAQMKDFVVRKKDGFPAYQLASVVDDEHFGVDGIIRGEDLWPSTLAQIYLSTLLPGCRFGEKVFHHHPLLLETGDLKMSKSAGSTSVQFLRKSGKAPHEIFSAIGAMMGIAAPVRDYLELTDAVL
ncbi:tRNA glutamyl-Q synthetase [Chitinophaga lutea]|uniref:tRNA glutamyl-Q synthetase n=1 Tax=Chitinophaga lutea TaxID=2488634 RepID=A0A3N4Q4D9_9BACT|nr:tRNA glutamyl-Q synthetase [Chitinophaga lutea]